MNALERLMAEYDNQLTFEFKNDMPDRLTGLLAGNTVYINANVPFNRAVASLAEEIGHHETLPDKDVTDYAEMANRKYENIARNWSYRKLIPFTTLKKYLEDRELVHRYEIAEELDLPEDIIEEAIDMYRKKGYL